MITTTLFLKDLKENTLARTDWEYVYLMLEDNARVSVKWEGRSRDLKRDYHLVGQDSAPQCPHCAILAGIETLAPILPLSSLRAARTRDQYLLLVDMGKLPCAAFGRDTSASFGIAALTGGWAADCHMGEGNPHTSADCAQHRKQR